MGLRYTIPFKGGKDSYLVEIHKEGYAGDVKELTGATSCFIVSGTDDDFIYTPIRTSTATINVLDSDLLLDLYSINNQHAPVKLYKNGVLEWTGYISPEQFTQPYTPKVQSVSVDCVSALKTLENIEYKVDFQESTITLWQLLENLIASAKGGYNGVYIPQSYGNNENVLERIKLIETNFTSEEMTNLEVMENVCNLLNWTCYDIGGYLYFVDADYTGNYRLYDETLTTYTEKSIGSLTLQDVGFNGSDTNTLDVIHGYNKASVKSINNVFDEIIKDEDYKQLKPYANGGYYIKTYSDNGSYAARKQFLKPSKWDVFSYKFTNGVAVELADYELDGMSLTQLNFTEGALLIKEANYKCKSSNDSTPSEDVTDFNYNDSVQIRINQTSNNQFNSMGLNPAIMMEGEFAVYADCAMSVDFTIDGYFDDEMVKPSRKFFNKKVVILIQCGSKYYDGTSWIDTCSTVSVDIDENGKIKSNKTPYTPYDLNGYIIPMDFYIGKPKVTIYCPVWMSEDAVSYITGTKIRSLKFGYAKKEGIIEEGENGDRIYENTVNEEYMSEADEIEFGIGSYNDDGATYSKALLGDDWLTDNLYCNIVGKNVRPEELMIRRIVNRYGETKIKLTESINMTDLITPLTSLYDESMVNKRFRMTSGEWDYERNRLLIQIQEDV